MTTIPALLTPSEHAVSGAPTPSPSMVSALPAVLLGGDDDTRLLLRGLLRLHHHRILLESATAEAIERMPPSSEPKILVVDAGTDPTRPWAEELASILKSRPDLRALVILPKTDAALESRARDAGACGILVRPFAIREFAEAVTAAGNGNAAP